MDSKFQKLRRKASLGDIEAQEELEQAKIKVGETPSLEYLIDLWEENKSFQDKYIVEAVMQKLIEFVNHHRDVVSAVVWDAHLLEWDGRMRRNEIAGLQYIFNPNFIDFGLSSEDGDILFDNVYLDVLLMHHNGKEKCPATENGAECNLILGNLYCSEIRKLEIDVARLNQFRTNSRNLTKLLHQVTWLADDFYQYVKASPTP